MSDMRFDNYLDLLKNHIKVNNCDDIDFNRDCVFIGKNFFINVICNRNNIIKLVYTKSYNIEGYWVTKLSDLLDSVTSLVKKDFFNIDGTENETN